MNWLRYIVLVCMSMLLGPVIIAQDEVSLPMQIVQNAIQVQSQEGYDKSIVYLESRQSDFSQDELGQLLYNWTLGLLHFNAGKYDIAKAPLTTTVEICESNISDVLTRECEPFLRAYYWLAQVDWFTNLDIERYWARLRRAKEVYESAGLTDTEFYAAINTQFENQQSGLNNKMASAFNFALSDNWEAAVPLLEEIQTYIEPKSSKDEIYYSLCYLLSKGYVKTDRLEAAEALLIQVLDELKNVGNQNAELYRMSLDNLGAVYYSLRNYKKSNELHQQAKILYEVNLDFGDDYVRCLMNCAGAQRELGYKSMAKMLVDVALRQARTNLDNTSQISLYTNLLGSISDNNQEQTYSEEEVRAIKIKPFIAFLTNAGAIYSDLDYIHDALSVLREAINYSDKIGVKDAYLFQNLGDIYVYHSRYAESVEWFEKALECPLNRLDQIKISYDWILSKYYCHDAAVSFLATKLSQEVCDAISSTFSFMSDEQRKQIWSSYSYYLPTLDAIIIGEGDSTMYGQLYDNLLYSKGLLLRTANQVRASILSSGDKNLIKDYTILERLKGQSVAEIDSQKCLSLQNDIENLEKSLIKSVRLFDEFSSANSIKWTNVQTVLRPSDIAIEFCRLPVYYRADNYADMEKEYCYYALSLKQGYESPHLIELCKEATLDALSNEDISDTDSLFNLIWQPLADELANVHNIYFAADGDLHKVAIEYLQTPTGEVMNDLYGMYRLSSTRVIAESNHTPSRQNAVLYGGLKYDLTPEELAMNSNSVGNFKASRSGDFTNLRYGVTDLPHTLQEVNDIATLFEASTVAEVHTITGIDGTEEAFKRMSGQSFDIIHLATHGFFWTENKAEEHNYVSFLADRDVSAMRAEDYSLLRSGLFFSGANASLRGESLPDEIEDGVLTAEEVSTMNLGDVDLVVMSACQTALGETTSEGVFGLQRGFKLAGANTLLMSLWKVDDEATCLLMTEFYRHYLSGKTKQESLHLAQQTLRKSERYSDPHYWAAFILLDAIM